MRDQYVGDVGDYVKLGLLRGLKAHRLGVIWYKTGGNENSSDGKFTEYLHDLQNKEYDEDLFKRLKQIVCKDEKRRIERLEKILKGASFYRQEIQTGENRTIWFRDACEKMCGCDLVFVDPDNGLHDEASEKHISLEEVKHLAKKHSLLIYHHLSRNQNHKTQIEDRLKTLKKEIGGSHKISAIRAARGASRVFFLLARKMSFNNNFEKFAEEWKCFLKAKNSKRHIPHYYEL